MSIKQALYLFILLAFSTTGWSALPDDPQLPLTVEADSVEVDKKNLRTVYSGGVVLSQGSLRLASDTLTVHLQDGKVESAYAEGTPAQFQQYIDKIGLVKGSAPHIQYLSSHQTIKLSGEAHLQQGDALFQGDLIEYQLSTGKLFSTGRTKTILPSQFFRPTQDETKPDS